MKAKSYMLYTYCNINKKDDNATINGAIQDIYKYSKKQVVGMRYIGQYYEGDWGFITQEKLIGEPNWPYRFEGNLDKDAVWKGKTWADKMNNLNFLNNEVPVYCDIERKSTITMKDFLQILIDYVKNLRKKNIHWMYFSPAEYMLALRDEKFPELMNLLKSKNFGIHVPIYNTNNVDSENTFIDYLNKLSIKYEPIIGINGTECMETSDKSRILRSIEKGNGVVALYQMRHDWTRDKLGGFWKSVIDIEHK